MFWQRLLKSKSLETLHREAFKNDESGLKRTLGVKDLLALGIGAVIGSGIFVTTGVAAAGSDGYLGAGPAVTLSFVVVAIACLFCALCYAEFASMIPVAGSAYTYSYATLGEFVAWIIGWDLILEYLVGNIAVSVSWSGYFVALVRQFGIVIPPWLCTPTQLAPPDVVASAPMLFGYHIVFNLPAILIVALLTWVLVIGMKESARLNNIIVVIKLAIIAFIVIVGAMYVNPDNWTPFMPNGWAGVQYGAAYVFFAYVGFDAISTAAEETENPGRNLPIGLIGALLFCTILYVAVALVVTGMLPYTQLGVAEPMVLAFELLHMPWAVVIIAVGVLISMTAVLLVFQMGQPRIFFSMARDGLFPKSFGAIHPVYRTPYLTTIGCGIFVALPAGFADVSSVLELCNIGTLFAFVVVCIGVIVMRYRNPEARRPFAVPFCPWIPLAGVASCAYLMAAMPMHTWIGFGIWLAVGVVVYALYGYHHSTLGLGEDDAANLAVLEAKAAPTATLEGGANVAGSSGVADSASRSSADKGE